MLATLQQSGSDSVPFRIIDKELSLQGCGEGEAAQINGAHTALKGLHGFTIPRLFI